MPLAVSLKHTCDCFVSKFSCLHAVGHAVWHQSNSEEVFITTESFPTKQLVFI